MNINYKDILIRNAIESDAKRLRHLALQTCSHSLEPALGIGSVFQHFNFI